MAAVGDEELLSHFLEGDERCFHELMQRYRNRVFRLAARLLDGDTSSAEDVAQQTFLKVFTAGRSFWGRGPFRSWLFTIAANLALSERRRRSRLVPAARETAVQYDPGGALDNAAEGEKLRKAVSTLPEKQRLVLTLRLDAELPFSEIGRAAGMSENSAKVNFHHAVTRLKRILSEDAGDEVR
jgi:RNA polymerase sigma-70 factor (ECF subfamily)